MSTVTSVLSMSVVKPAVVFGLCVAGDKFLLNEPYFEKSVIFGACCGGSVALASTAGAYIVPYIPSSFATNETFQTVEGRIVEIGLGSASFFLVSNFILKNDLNQQNLLYKLGLLTAADVVGEFVAKSIIAVV